MGIAGLLPLLKSISKPVQVGQYAGKKVAVDTYSWLYKGAFSASAEICKGISTDRHIEFCMSRVQLMRHHNVIPVLVFDGGILPMKQGQEEKRNRSRKENLDKAVEHEKNGNMKAAMECYQRALDITPDLAHQLIQVLRKEGVEFIVAPYEADAQLTYLCKEGYVHAVISEDSDLIAYGCPKVLFKMDKFGQGMEISHDDMPLNADLKLQSFSKQMITEMCIFSGCDYLPSLPGFGMKRAHGIVHKFRSVEKAIKSIRFSGALIPESYEREFKRALKTFLHQRVFDPRTRRLVHLHPLTAGDEDDLDYLGPDLPADVAEAIAVGLMNPITRRPFQTLSNEPRNDETQQQLDAEKAASKPQLLKLESKPRFQFKKRSLELPVQKNKLARYLVAATPAAKRQFNPPRFSPSPPPSATPAAAAAEGTLPDDLPPPCTDLRGMREAMLGSGPAIPANDPSETLPPRSDGRVLCQEGRQGAECDSPEAERGQQGADAPIRFRPGPCTSGGNGGHKVGFMSKFMPPRTSPANVGTMSSRGLDGLPGEKSGKELRNDVQAATLGTTKNPFARFSKHGPDGEKRKRKNNETTGTSSPKVGCEREDKAERPGKANLSFKAHKSSYFAKAKCEKSIEDVAERAIEEILGGRSMEQMQENDNVGVRQREPHGQIRNSLLVDSLATNLSHIPKFNALGHDAIETFVTRISSFGNKSKARPRVAPCRQSITKKAITRPTLLSSEATCVLRQASFLELFAHSKE